MTLDLRLEQLYRQIELVKGVGDPRRGQLCVMSFVALLAGESHSDSPATASTVIRRFAIPLNDRMPPALRQRLKPFAPRIIGTRDACDAVRADILANAVRGEIMPRVQAEFGPARSAIAWLGGVRELHQAARALLDRLSAFEGTDILSRVPEVQSEIAMATAQLICLAARSSPRAEDAEWYWNKGIDLLDRLCDVGNGKERPPVDSLRIAWIEMVLARRERLAQRTAIGGRTLERLRCLLPLRGDTH
jgi:hypothetical protein